MNDTEKLIIDRIDRLEKRFEKRFDVLYKRIDKINGFRYKMMGGFVVLSGIIGTFLRSI